VKKDPNGHVTLTQSPPPAADTTPQRSRVRSLGRSYCDGLRFLERQGVSKVINLVRALREAVTPSVAFAQVSQQARDTTRPAQDSLRARGDSAQRPDTTPRSDSTQKKDTVPPARPYIVSSKDYVDTAAAVARPIPPSAGVASTLPATIEMDTQRAQMLSSRAQMNQYAVEIHKKFAISVACIIFVLLGAPLALRFPRGGVGLVLVVSLVVFALYYIGLIAGESLADRNILRPSLAMWAANIVFGFAGVVMLSRMERQGGASRGADAGEWLENLRRAGRRLTRRGAGA
jgi:lipopolysaccharide export system permease protein